MAAKVARRGRIARRLGLLVVAAVLATSVGFPALAPAQTSATVPVTGGSWYWQEQVGTVAPPAGSPLPPVAPPGALPTPDVPAGDFPVSVVGGQPDKESFLQLDSSAIAAGSTVSSLVLTLNEDSAGGNVNAAMATVEARAVTGFMAGGAQGAPWANRPSYDTSGPFAAGKRNAADGSWTFELAPIAARWTSGDLSNNGIALVPAAPQQGQAYEVVWFGPKGAKPPTVAGSITPPASGTPEAQAAGVESTPTGEASAPVSITPDTSGADLTSGASVASPPTAAAGPTAAPSTRTPARVRTIGSTHRAPPWGFYLAIAAVIALIGASTLSLGELGEPEPERQGGVLRTLERQRERSEQV